MGVLRLTRFIAARLLPRADREFILGDLDEMHRKWSREHGPVVAARRYLGALLASIAAQRAPRSGTGGSANNQGKSPVPRRSGLPADLRQASRLFRHRPGFVVVVALTLGLGVGSAGVVFSMANQLLLRPPPGVADQRGTAVLEFRTNDRDYVGISGPDMLALRAAATLLGGFAATDTLPSAPYVSTGASRPVTLNAFTVYGDYFELLGVRPRLGRLLGAEETGPGAEPLAAVISERLWEVLFGRSPDVIGRQIRMSGQRLRVVGVAADGFRGTDAGWPVDAWVPKPAFAPFEGYPPDRIWSRDSRLNQDFIVRLRRGVTPAAAQEQLDGIIAGLAAADPEYRDFLDALHTTLTPGLLRRTRHERVVSTLGAFGGAAALVLLIACANVANLQLVRTLQSRSELAIRRALGASAFRVARQHLVESVLLATAGTLAGLLVAGSIGWLFQGDPLLDFQGFVLDTRMVGFAVAAIAGTTILFGTLPAALAGRLDLDAALRGAGRTATRRDSLTRHAMSALQIALSLTLLIGAALLTRTVQNLYTTELGIDVQDVSILLIDFGHDRPDDEGFATLYRELPEAAAAVRGVERAAVDGWYGPFRGRPSMQIALPGAPDDAAGTADMRRVTPGWFDVLAVEPLLGRTFRESDARASSPPVVVLTSRLAQRLFGRIDVVGQRVRVGRRPPHEAEIIGVVGDVRIADVRSDPDEAVFLPLVYENMGPVALLVRTSNANPATASAIRRAVEGVIPSIAVPQPTPLADRINDQLAEQRVFMRLLGLLSLLAVALAAIGLYGVIAFAVAGRRREFGIRMAIGADGPRITALVAWSAARIVASGTVLGLAGAYALSGVIESRLFGVEAVDFVSYAGAAVVLAAVAALACMSPALAAAGVDPAETLRQE